MDRNWLKVGSGVRLPSVHLKANREAPVKERLVTHKKEEMADKVKFQGLGISNFWNRQP